MSQKPVAKPNNSIYIPWFYLEFSHRNSVFLTSPCIVEHDLFCCFHVLNLISCVWIKLKHISYDTKFDSGLVHCCKLDIQIISLLRDSGLNGKYHSILIAAWQDFCLKSTISSTHWNQLVLLQHSLKYFLKNFKFPPICLHAYISTLFIWNLPQLLVSSYFD